MRSDTLGRRHRRTRQRRPGIQSRDQSHQQERKKKVLGSNKK